MSYHHVNFPEFIKNHKDPIIFDIGSYNGADAVAFKQRFPNSKVYAFEASSVNMSKFTPPIREIVDVRHLAIGEVNGEITFYPSLGWADGSGSLLKPSDSLHNITFGKEVVPCMTIEAFCESESIENVDCMHIDAQGAEYKILSNLGKIRPDCIYAETSAYDQYHDAGTMEDLDNLLKTLGYRVQQRHYGPDNCIWDTFYVNEERF